MLATFCLRLACGMMASLLLLSPRQVNPRFYRVVFLATLGLVAGVAAEQAHRPVVRASLGDTGGLWLWALLSLALGLAFVGSLIWSLEACPGGGVVVILTTLSLAATLALPVAGLTESVSFAWRVADGLTSAALLGLATSAMLMGHSYLVSPGMSPAPLLQLLRALFIGVGLRMVVAGIGLWSWASTSWTGGWSDGAVLWLPLRWGLGFAGPLVLGWMAWQAAKIRSTQSATGILYVVVVFCFLGELTSQLMQGSTGFVF